MVDRRPHTLLTVLQDLAILAARPLRKKAVLFVILAISVIYCILSLAHIHLINARRLKMSKHQQNYGYEYDIDTVLDSSDHHIPPPPNILSSMTTPSGHQSSHDEFAFLKRQHNLKESLEEAAAAAKSGHSSARGHLLDDHPPGASTSDTLIGPSSGGIKCRNSIQGKHLIADDRGYVCQRKVVGINGCCSTSANLTTTKLYSCESCHSSGCCAIYEYCISCCMAPQNRELLNRLVNEKKSPVFKIFIASITDYFELCLTKCRTSSASVQHENTYRNPEAKHCYSDSEVTVIKQQES